MVGWERDARLLCETSIPASVAAQWSHEFEVEGNECS